MTSGLTLQCHLTDNKQNSSNKYIMRFWAFMLIFHVDKFDST